MPAHPEVELPPDLLAAAEQAITHRDELYQLGCKLGQWFCRNGYAEDECEDWLLNQSPLQGNYTARQFEYQLKRAVGYAYETYDPAKRCGQRQAPADPKALQALLESVSGAKVKHKKYTLLLIQHAINQGVSPVFITARQLASLAGAKNWSKANEALVYLEQTQHPEGIVTGVSRELVHYGGHSYLNRAFTLNEHWEGYINIMHGTYVSLSAKQAAEAKRVRAEQRKARKAERERYDREHEFRMRYFAWESQQKVRELLTPKPLAADPFKETPVYPDPFEGPSFDPDAPPPWETDQHDWPPPVIRDYPDTALSEKLGAFFMGSAQAVPSEQTSPTGCDTGR